MEDARYKKRVKNKKREEYVKTYGQSVVSDARELLRPKVANHKDLFIRCVDKIFNRWIKGVYKSEVQVIEAIQSTFYKKISFEEGYNIMCMFRVK